MERDVSRGVERDVKRSNALRFVSAARLEKPALLSEYMFMTSDAVKRFNGDQLQQGGAHLII